jgi:hypothetical protein
MSKEQGQNDVMGKKEHLNPRTTTTASSTMRVIKPIPSKIWHPEAGQVGNPLASLILHQSIG